MTDINDVLAAIRPVERTVALCLRGDLLAQWDDLERQLQAAQALPAGSGSLGTLAPGVAIARKMDAIRAEMVSASREFRLRGLTSQVLSDLMAAHPPTPDHAGRQAWNPATFNPALIAACCVDPVMTAEQAEQLLANLNRGQLNALFNAAWDASTGAVDIPFSEAASEVLRGTDAK